MNLFTLSIDVLARYTVLALEWNGMDSETTYVVCFSSVYLAKYTAPVFLTSTEELAMDGCVRAENENVKTISQLGID